MKNLIFILLLCVGVLSSFKPMDDFDFIEHQRARLRAIEAQMEQSKSIEAVKTVEVEVAKVAIANAETAHNSELPDAIKQLKEKKSKAFSEMNRLHAQLELLPDDDARHKSAIRIIELEQLIGDYWTALHRYNDTGEIPKDLGSADTNNEIRDLSEANPTDLIRMRNNARAYISKNRHKEAKQEQVAKKQKLIDQIEILIS